MDEMTRYIFGSLRDSETTLRIIFKSLKKQEVFNRSVAFFSMIVALHLVIQELEIRNMHRELNDLKKEIKELKNSEGE